jgi:ATP-dependent Lhr-like helicase
MRAILDLFSAPARDWFEGAFAAPTEVQVGGWAAVADGRHTLMCAPTGSGKTLAAFLWCLEQLGREPLPATGERCRVLYISPLKALTVDIERNLRAPLAGMRLQAERQELPLPEINVAIRTGDTPQNERRQIARHPPDILITTPESLFLMLTSAARVVLKSVRWVIVDEIHAMAATKRGAHLALSLERLATLTAHEPQRIGLSATQRPLEATDPASPYGVSVAWPPSAGRTARVAGAYVVLDGGQLRLYLERGGRSLLTFGGVDRRHLAALARVATRAGKVEVTTIDGEPAAGSSLGPAMREVGFGVSPRGLVIWPERRDSATA